MNLKPAQQLINLLSRWDRRQRVQQSFVWVPRGMIVGLAAGIILAVVARLQPWLMPEQLTIASGITVIAGILAALGTVWLRQYDALTLARRFDDLFELKERVSTSLEMIAGRIQSPNEEINERLLDDAVERASSINARAYLPLRWVPRDWALLGVLFLTLGLLLILDNPQTTAMAAEQAIQNTIQNQIAELENLRQQIEAESGLDEATREELVEAIEQAIEQLSQEELSQEEAVATLSNLAEQIGQIAETPELETGERRAFEQAAQHLTEEAGEVATAFEQSQLQQASQALSDLSDSLAEMEQAEQLQLAEALEAAAQELAETNPELAQALQDAADALEQGNTEQAEQALDQASQQVMRQAEQSGNYSEQNMRRQVASQAAQQAQESAQQIARTGRDAQQPGQTAPPQSGEGATRIEQTSPETEGSSSVQGQAGENGEEGENADGGAGMGEEEATEGESETGGAAGGAGDAEGVAQEGGIQGSGQQISQDNNPTGEGLSEYEPIYAPQAIGDQTGESLDISGSGEPGDIVTNEGNLAESPEGESTVGYDQVFSDYSNAANEAMERDHIPLSLRDVVRDYFTSLEP
jgi:chemotaxis protein histidine kinase CheA